MGYTLSAPPEVALILLHQHLPWRAGDRGCADVRPFAVVPAGTQMKIPLPSDESTQIVACMNDVAVALGYHIMVKRWQDNDDEVRIPFFVAFLPRVLSVVTASCLLHAQHIFPCTISSCMHRRHTVYKLITYHRMYVDDSK